MILPNLTQYFSPHIGKVFEIMPNNKKTSGPEPIPRNLDKENKH
jgi:hypothetical protein